MLVPISVLAVSLALIPPAPAAENHPRDLSEMSVEDLLSVRVITAAKKEQKVGRTASAVYVITAEDIERSGLTSVPEVLRLAPGLEVARINSNTWAISIRGFNSQFSNKLLVLIDGRSVYSPNFSGVLWNVQDLLLEDIERIEIIRGPGAAVWGANAVNGVINIITKSPLHSQGGLLTATGGSYDQALAGVRYGGHIGDAAFRLSARYALRGTLAAPNEGPGSNHDRWDLQRGSFRADWSSSQRNKFLFEADLYQSPAGATAYLPVLGPPFSTSDNALWYYSGGSLLARWKHLSSNSVESTWQAFYDRSHEGSTGFYGTTDTTCDVDFQQQARLRNRHEVVWGMAVRVVSEATSGSFFFSYIPTGVTTKLFSGFAQDDIALVPERLWLTVGSKFEHNDYTGAEIQPNVRLLWTPHPKHSTWLAFSRAVRSPSLVEERINGSLAAFPAEGGIPGLLRLLGNPRFGSETAYSYEAGYRTAVERRVSIDLAVFYTDYRRLSGILPDTPFPELVPEPPHLVAPIILGNYLSGHGAGVEAAAKLSLTQRWKLTGSYSWLHLRTSSDEAYPGAVSTYPDGANPEHQFQMHSQFDLPRNVQLDLGTYYTGRLHLPAVPAGNLPESSIPSYTRLDGRIAWSPAERLRLSAVAQDLLTPRHLEFIGFAIPVVAGEVRRSFYGKAEWRF
jgi:iron complex outermembrane receptor protein